MPRRSDVLLDSLLHFASSPPSACACPSSAVEHEVLSGTRVYREVKGRKVYTQRCSKCGRSKLVDGGAA